MSAAAMPMPRLIRRPAILPWAVSVDDERRFKRILRVVLIACALFAVVMPWLPVRAPERAAPEALPPRLTKLILERETPPPPRPQPPPEVAAPATTPVLPKDEPKAQVVPARKPDPTKAPGERLEKARERASGVGLLAMKDELADLRGAPAAVQLKDVKPGPGVGTGEGVGVGAGIGPGIPERSLITSNATGGSGGINTGRFSRDTGGGGLAGRATTLVEGVAGGRGGGGPGAGTGGTGLAGKGGTLQRGASGKASRSIEEIKIVFERNKGAIYAIYNRSLRDDPSLQGKVVLELKIAPSGQVMDLRIVSSELRNEDLERKLLARIRQFDFGAKDVDVMQVTWPVDFLPS
jgi:TonB family protein